MRKILVALAILAALFPGVASAGTLETCQQVAHYLNSPGVLYFLGAIAIVGGIMGLLSPIIRSLNAVGVIGCLLAAGMISYSFWAPASMADFLPKEVVTFIGALVFAPSLGAALSGQEGPRFVYFGILTAVYAIAASVFLNNLTGFLAVLAFVGMLGFTAFGGGLSYAIGFEDTDHIPGATIAGIMLAAGYTVLKTNGIEHPLFSVFEGGAFWVGTFVAGIGILIVSSKWYGGSGKDRAMPYPLRLVISLALLCGGIYAGILTNDGALLYITAAFLMLFIIEKLYEMAPEGVVSYSLLTIMLGVAAVFGGGWLSSHMDVVQGYIAAVRG